MEVNEKKNIFRENSLERLSSPERLDQLLQVVSRRDWLPLGSLGALIVVAIIWSIFGRIPVNFTSKGVLIRPHRVVNVDSPISAQLKELKVKIGDCIKKNEVLATIDPSDLKQKLNLERAKLLELQLQEREANSLQVQRTNLERKTIQQQRDSLQKRLLDSQALTPVLRNKGIVAIQQQRTSLQQQLRDAKNLTSILEQRVQKRRFLLREGALSEDMVLQAEQEYRQRLQSISVLEAQLKQLDVTESETERRYLENLSGISQLEAQLQELETKDKRLEQENLQASSNRKNQIEEVKRNIAQFEKQYDDNRQIKSPHAGCILELTASSGSVLNQGTRLGSIQVGDTSSQMVGVAYFPVGVGKKIKPGMKLQITPDMVHRERFGGIVGTVTSVSTFPVTKQGATSLVGNAEVVEGLMPQGKAMIEVRGQLQLDSSTPSGYEWSSSQGPSNLKISTGTTATTRVTVEEQAPITFVLPILREWSGLF
ncbi:MAG: NHLP bacteriocin system secretion protein [Symploca sp. SIO3C6]|nr:NHLP bacteriocin system secretion protein [Symploca sp. SIO3C6]